MLILAGLSPHSTFQNIPLVEHSWQNRPSLSSSLHKCQQVILCMISADLYAKFPVGSVPLLHSAQYQYSCAKLPISRRNPGVLTPAQGTGMSATRLGVSWGNPQGQRFDSTKRMERKLVYSCKAAPLTCYEVRWTCISKACMPACTIYFV